MREPVKWFGADTKDNPPWIKALADGADGSGLRPVHQLQLMTLMGFAKGSTPHKLSARRPCERTQGPIRRVVSLCIGADASRNHGRQGLWVPAFVLGLV
jgi:hypothetical protein